MTTRTRKKPNTDHIVARGAGGLCLHCGAKVEFKLPIDLGDFCALSAAFVKQHARCKPRSESASSPSPARQGGSQPEKRNP
jgi:hypothetical protein